MPSYDLVYIVKPDLEADATNAVVERVTKRLGDQGAAIEHSETWGKRRMAYSIQRYREGLYIFARFAAPGDRIPAIRHELKIMEDVLRASITLAVGSISQKAAQTPAAGAESAAVPPPSKAEPAASEPERSEAPHA